MRASRLRVTFPFVILGLAALGVGLSTTAGCKGKGGNGAGGGSAKERHVVVLFTSDEHSHLFGFSPERDDYPVPTSPGSGTLKGGVARRAVVIARERKAAAAAGKDSILVSAGDNQMGCLPHLVFESKSIDYATMKALGYDATTFGNHELDFGPAALASSIATARANGGLPPIVASNVHFSASDPADDTLAAEFGADPNDDKAVHAYRVIKTASGVKVGVLGYVGINAAHVAPNKTPVQFSVPSNDPKKDADVPSNLPSLYADLQPVVDQLRNTEKVDLVIALAHGGVKDTSSQAGIDSGEDTQVCDNVSGIDFIVSGHAHNHDPVAMKRTNQKTGKPCLVMNAGAFGEELGRIDFAIPSDPSKGVSWDPSTRALLPIDDTTVPDPSLDASIDGFLDAIETEQGQSSTLAGLLSHAFGMTVQHDPSKHGDLYFMPLANTSFDVVDTHALIYLSADSMLAASDQWAAQNGGVTTDVAVDSAGLIRSVLEKGQTGVIDAADAFDVVPLGASPVDKTIGYPLIRGYVSALELRGVVEFALARDPGNSDYDLGFAGMQVQFDTTRPKVVKIADLFDPTKGQVMKLSISSSHANGFEQFDKVIYDRSLAMNDTSRLVSFVTTSYVGEFATDAGVTIKDATANPLPLTQAILHRADSSEIKGVESFMGFIHGAPSGALPSTYDVQSPSYTKRWVCLAGC